MTGESGRPSVKAEHAAFIRAIAWARREAGLPPIPTKEGVTS